MPYRRMILTVTLAASVLALSATSASATTRFAAPFRLIIGGPPAGCTDPAKPCSLPGALAAAVSGDDVSLEPGDYRAPVFVPFLSFEPFADTLEIASGVTVHGDSMTDLPVIHSRVNSQAEASVNLASGAKLRDVVIEGTAADATPIAYSLSLSSGALAERVKVRTTAAANALLIACSISGGAIRDSLCLGTGAATGGTVVGVSASVTTSTFSLNNVTAITTVPNSDAIRTGTSSGTTTLTVSNVIARGTKSDLFVRAGVTGGNATMNVDHSNWVTQSVSAVAGGTAKLVHTGPNQNGATAAEPLFVDAPNGDYREAPGSPTIDAGVIDPTANGLLAFGGADRVIGKTTDIGAFEFDPASIPPPAPPTGGGAPPAPVVSGASSGPPADRTAPRLTGLALARSFTRAQGTKLRFTLSEAAKVTLTFSQPKTGRRVGRSCRKTTRSNRRRPPCTIANVRGRLVLNGDQGANAIAFKGRLAARRQLGAGRYKLTAVAVDPAGNRSAASTRRFAISARSAARS